MEHEAEINEVKEIVPASLSSDQENALNDLLERVYTAGYDAGYSKAEADAERRSVSG